MLILLFPSKFLLPCFFQCGDLTVLTVLDLILKFGGGALFVCLGPHLQHREVPRLEMESELQPPAYTTATAMQDLSYICDLPHSS